MPDEFHLDDAQLREILQLVSHDLRNPLAAIVTNLEFAKRLLSRSSVDPDLVESVDDSVIACDVLRRIVANFDVLVRGRSMSVSMHEFDVAGAIVEVIGRCQARADQATLALEFQGAERRVRAMLDRQLFSLALENLIANSLQYAPRNSFVRVTLESNESRTRVAVEDNGSAVPEALRGHAVSAQAHTPSGRTDATRYGRGLGLLAAHAITTVMGCDLVLEGDAEHSVIAIDIPMLVVT
jgi:two-component system, OmpR family, sensor kinase